jgi:hypothetical protein
MRLIRWGLATGVVILNFVMNAPVWWALAHIDLAGGSAGHHRAELVDNFIGHFSDWWLIGTTDYPNWGFLMMDISNQYVAEGECGGLVSFVCLITIISVTFSRLGKGLRLSRGSAAEWYFWFLGSALFAHVIAFFGISYFDQIRYAWYALLAMIAVATSTRVAERNRKAPVGQHETEPTAGDLLCFNPADLVHRDDFA